MPTHSSNLRLTYQGDGENQNTWGDVANNQVFALLEDSITSLESITATGSGVTLSTNNGSADQSRAAMLKITGTLTQDHTITIPAVSKHYIVWNATSGDYSLTIKTSGGTGVTVEQGNKAWVMCDGTDTYQVSPDLLNADLDANNKNITQGNFNDYSTTAYDLGNISGAVSVDYRNGGYQYGTLTGNITSLTINNFPASGKVGSLILELKQDGSGSRTISLSSAYETAGGASVALSTSANAVDLLYLITRDGGSTIRASLLTDFQ